MALYKSVRQYDGVVTSYHRILYIMSITNSHISIVVGSYVDETARRAELDNTLAQPYIQTTTYETDYAGNMTTGAAYEYLKTLPAFVGATDI